MSDDPSWFSIQQKDDMVVISPSDSNDKCISAQVRSGRF